MRRDVFAFIVRRDYHAANSGPPGGPFVEMPLHRKQEWSKLKQWRCQNLNATSVLIDVGERSLGRLIAESYHGFGFRPDAQRWRVILRSRRSDRSYTG